MSLSTHHLSERNLRFQSLDYTEHKNSFWRLKIFERFKESFNIERFELNLKEITILAQKNHHYVSFSDFYHKNWGIYHSFIKNFDNYFVDSKTQLSKTIPFVNNNALRLAEIGELVQKKNKSSSQSWVIISDDHRISHATIKELTRQSGVKTAVVVIDNHADIYNTSPKKEAPLKFNPFRCLIKSGSVEHVIFLCPKFTEILSNQKMWHDVSEDVSFVPFQSTLTGELFFDQELFTSIFADIVNKKQIQNIFFSIDIDALVDPTQQRLYTAFEYSILNSLLHFSLLSGSQVRLINAPLTSVIILKKDISDKFLPLGGVKLRNPYQPNFNTVNEIGISPFVYTETIKTVSKLAREMGISVGLGSCFGEVVELFGPDWRGETTKVVLDVTKTLNNL